MIAKALLDAVNQQLMMDDVERLCRFDRYQASDGINAAVDWLGDAFCAEGAAVQIERRCVTEDREWVGFSAPVSWTPGPVTLEVAGLCHLDLRRDPFLAAVHSAPMECSTLALRDWDGGPTEPNILYLIPETLFTPADFEAAGGRSFVTDAGAKPTGSGEFAGRVELPADTDLTGFCVSTPMLEQLRFASRANARATLRFEVHRKAPMPVLEATLPGQGEGELWVMAHVCHLRPGANDNASGVAGLLSLVRTLVRLQEQLPNAKRPRLPNLKVIAGPEFTGISSLLSRKAGLPQAVLNFDMIGQGRRFRLERDPGPEGALLVARAEHWISLVFGEAGLDWSPMPFLGYSDNAVFAAGSCRVPTVQFCHDLDPLNHSAGDVLANICSIKMAASLAAAVGLICTWNADEDEAIFHRWLDREIRAIEVRASYWRNRGAGQWADAFEIARTSELRGDKKAAHAARGIVDGPFNLRAIIGQLDRALLTEVNARTKLDKGFHAALGQSVIQFERGLEAPAAIELASFSLGRPIGPSDTQIIKSALEELASLAKNDCA